MPKKLMVPIKTLKNVMPKELMIPIEALKKYTEEEKSQIPNFAVQVDAYLNTLVVHTLCLDQLYYCMFIL
jgi:hypothetical protein